VEHAWKAIQGTAVEPLVLTEVELVTKDNLMNAMVDALDMLPGGTRSRPCGRKRVMRIGKCHM
jgi:hypothetical protein